MSILDHITVAGATAPRITLYGKPGIGKTTLASQFPDPLFLLTENAELPGIKALPVIKNYVDVHKVLKALLKEETLPFKTLVVDSISKLDAIIVKYILDTAPLNGKGEKHLSLNTVGKGYGEGYGKAQYFHRLLKELFDQFKDRGITVIFISHLDVKKYKAPDFEDYDIYTIVMNADKSREVYIDDVDLVAFCRLRSFEGETESGRKLINSTGERVVFVGAHDGHISKNRYNMPDEIEMSFDAFAKYIPFYQTKEKQQ